MKVLFGSCMDCIVTVLLGMARHALPSSVYPITIPTNFIFEWEISRLWHYIVRVAVRVRPAIDY